MKKQFTLFFTVLFFTFLLVSSCQKETTVPPTKSEHLTKSSWKFSSATASGTDISNNPSIVCIKDDIVIFLSNGNGSVSEGVVICTPTTAGNFTWSFQNNETQLMMSAGLFPGGSGLFNIVTLNETTLAISQNVIIPPSSTSILVIATYTH